MRKAISAVGAQPFGVIGDQPLNPIANLATAAIAVDNGTDNNGSGSNGGTDNSTSGGDGSGPRLRCDTTSSASNQGGGFVWKPVSEADGRLVVLFEASRAGRIARAALVQRQTDGDVVLETLDFQANTNGGRPTF